MLGAIVSHITDSIYEGGGVGNGNLLRFWRDCPFPDAAVSTYNALAGTASRVAVTCLARSNTSKTAAWRYIKTNVATRFPGCMTRSARRKAYMNPSRRNTPSTAWIA